MYIRADTCSKQKESMSGGGGGGSGSGEGRDPQMWKDRGPGENVGKKGGGRRVRRMHEKNGVTGRSMAGRNFHDGSPPILPFRCPPRLCLPAAFSLTSHITHDTYFSLACESEGTDDPFPFAYIVVVMASQFFQCKHKRAAKFALCALDSGE